MSDVEFGKLIVLKRSSFCASEPNRALHRSIILQRKRKASPPVVPRAHAHVAPVRNAGAKKKKRKKKRKVVENAVSRSRGRLSCRYIW